jgi:diaminohydroxyphosphoribosylaminopyrimidine deaminase/5-amino-6-(5-phosphoribosylamino)uracil reductase
VSENTNDEHFLRRALELAREGEAQASPNPYVGAVIIDQAGVVIGTGVHTYSGIQHAEVRALEQAGGKARGGTLYINLEPHSHQGRTPPCTDALIAAGIRRVVASMADPNPKVSGRGFEKLSAAGIEVVVGGLDVEARELNEAFACYIRRAIPLVTLKSAMTLDGKIAPGHSETPTPLSEIPPGRWITGEASRAHVQQQRHQADAIMVGIGTILADDPLLTDRSGRPRRRPLLRVILDSQLRLPLESRLAKSAANDVIVFCSSTDERKKRDLEARGVRVEQVSSSGTTRGLDLLQVVKRLGELEIISLIIEGGSSLNATALASGIVDKVFLYYAPQILGADAVPFASAATANQSPRFAQLKKLRLHRFAEDIAVEGYLRDPYAD